MSYNLSKMEMTLNRIGVTNPQQQKQIHGKNKKDSTAETENVKIRSKTNPRQKLIHGRNKKDSTQNRKEGRAIRA